MKNYFALYQDFVQNSEPPAVFHAWSSISAISALLGKKCFVPQGHFTVFPQLYVVLVGDAGSRKTTAMDVARKLVEMVEEVPIAPDSATRESLIDEMSDSKVCAELNGRDVSYWQSSAFVSELEQFLGGRHINQAMVGFLTAIWDRDIFKERTRKGGNVIVHNPYFTMLGCCTTSWMNDKLKQDVISDGFSRRTIFALGTKLSNLVPWPVTSAASMEAKTKLAMEVKRIFAIKGQFQITKEALVIYSTYYQQMREEGKKYSEKVQNYFSSKHVLLLKVAMCISAGVSSNMLIDSAVLNAALAFLASSEKHLDDVFSGVGRNELKAQADKILNRIKTAGTMRRAELLLLSYDDVNLLEFGQIIETLIASEQITVAPELVPGDQVFRAVEVKKSAPENNLLLLASRLSTSKEVPVQDSEAFELARRLAPATEKLLERQRTHAQQTKGGLLRKGKTVEDLA